MDFIRQAIVNNNGATVFGYYVNDPQRYGVVEFDNEGNVVSLEEKPLKPNSNYAVVGLYVYNNSVVDYVKELKPSARGELEITDLNKIYLKENKLRVEIIGRGIAWLDTGTPQALLDVSTFIGAIEKRQGLKVACIEEVAYMMNYIDEFHFDDLIKHIPDSDYKYYLDRILKDKKLVQIYNE
jgi:glucose-1-phosphate thymidylyltransferase